MSLKHLMKEWREDGPPLPRSVSAEELIWAWLREGWRYRVAQGNRRMVERKQEYMAQINSEMSVIVPQDFCDYFALVSRIVRYAKDNGIPVGPGRGSSAASLVCYLLRITEVDPMQFPLMDFSRFIVPGREDLPDIDIDFDDERRHEVQQMVIDTFGAARVGNVATFTKYKGKNAIDDVARVHQLPKGDMETLKGMIVERSGGDSRADAALADTISMFQAAQEIVDRHPALKYAMQLEGGYRGMSIHAAGMVVTNTPIAEVCAQYVRSDSKGHRKTAISVNKYDAEYLNLMKVDILGLSTMGMLRIALEESGMTLEDLYRIPLDDPRTVGAFTANDVVGIFQFEGRATRLVGRDIKPDNFLEMVDVNGLSRPGPLFSGTTAEYIDVKWGCREPVRLHPIIDEITKGTKGTIIYQEQILRALAQFGGLPVRRVHEIRRIISLKLGEAQFNTSFQAFADTAMQLHGVSFETAQSVWSRVVTSASYAFVYAHSLAYAMIGYWAMYMKQHHPEAFYTAQLRKTEEKGWHRLIRDAERHGVRVSSVIPGKSQRLWSVQDGAVVAGWQQLKGVGEVTANRILAFQEDGGQITCADDLEQVSGIGPKTVEKFRAQIESDDPFGLLKTKMALDAVRDAIESREIPLRRATTTSDGILDIPGGATVVWLGRAKLKEYKDAIEDERARSGKEIEQIKAEMKDSHLVTSCVLHCYDDGEEDVYLRVSRHKYPQLAAGLEKIRVDHDVVWALCKRSRGGFGASLYVEKIVVIDPDDEDDE